MLIVLLFVDLVVLVKGLRRELVPGQACAEFALELLDRLVVDEVVAGAVVRRLVVRGTAVGAGAAAA